MGLIGITDGAFDNLIAGAIHKNLGHKPKPVYSLENLDGISGLVLSGGGDIHPERYDEPMSNLIWGVDKFRDELEFTAVEQCINNEVPIMGICRGHQVLGAYFGFKLIPDISRNHLPWHENYHSIYGPMVRFGDTVNSLHHQAVPNSNDAIKNAEIEVLALADNNKKGDKQIIEAMRNNQFISVQWHPELNWHKENVSLQAFLYFKEMVDAKN